MRKIMCPIGPAGEPGGVARPARGGGFCVGWAVSTLGALAGRSRPRCSSAWAAVAVLGPRRTRGRPAHPTSTNVRDGRATIVTSLYEKLGEEAAIAKVVDGFYERVLADGSLAPFFDGVDMPALRRHQAAFLGAATGGPQPYTGPDLAAAHAGRGITDEHFDRVAEHLAAALANAGVTP